MANKYLAVIREAECIGCTKCIEVCPVDAILGSNKHMHTVITQECIGCKLCIPPCPVDCIDLVQLAKTHSRIPPDYVKQRHQARQIRLKKENDQDAISLNASVLQRKQYIQEALTRTKAKKSQ